MYLRFVIFFFFFNTGNLKSFKEYPDSRGGSDVSELLERLFRHYVLCVRLLQDIYMGYGLANFNFSKRNKYVYNRNVEFRRKDCCNRSLGF